MARWASRSFARFRANCDGVRVETLLVPAGAKIESVTGVPLRLTRQSNPEYVGLPFRLVVLDGSADGDRVMSSLVLLGVGTGAELRR